jgi:uroporphyrinogen decarboxylase
MSLTSRERVMCTFEHREADRVPAWCGSSPEFWDKAKRELGLDDEGLRVRLGDDFRRVLPIFRGPDTPLTEGAIYRSPFGIDRMGIGYGQPLAHPLLGATLEEVHAYPWPDPGWEDVSHARAEALAYGGQYAILGGAWSPFFHDFIDLVSMDGMAYLFHDEPEIADAIIQHIVDYYYEVSRRMFEAGADAIDIFFIGNDFGTQNGPMLGTKQFRRFMLPHLKRLVDLGHAYGLKVQLHCCGGFRPLISDMIEIGLDALHAVQPSCRGMDLAALKHDYGEAIVFNGAIDSHHVLIEGPSIDFVRAKTREVLDIMKPGGGYIAGPSHDYVLEETPLANVLAMYDTIREYGLYQEH